MIYLDFFMNLLESSLIINQLLYKIYYQHNFFVFNKCIYWFLKINHYIYIS